MHDPTADIFPAHLPDVPARKLPGQALLFPSPSTGQPDHDPERSAGDGPDPTVPVEGEAPPREEKP